MKPNTQTQNTTKQPSTKPSITGGILSILALLSSGFAHLILALNSSSKTSPEAAHGAVEKAGVAVSNGSFTALAVVISTPFAFVGVGLGLIALIFTLMRLGKVKSSGLMFSILWIVLAVWAIKAGIDIFSMVKAHSA